MRGVHDMGGLKAGPVERVEHDYQLWEKRVDALMVLLSRKRRFTVDELRKGIEFLPGDAYDRSPCGTARSDHSLSPLNTSL